MLHKRAFEGREIDQMKTVYETIYSSLMERELALTVMRNSDEPVYRQIARQIRRLVASGRIAPGDEMPAVRTVASDLGVNLNTVARAYRILENEGFLFIRSRSGVRVAHPASAESAIPKGSLREELQVVLARLYQSGVSMDEIRRITSTEIESIEEPRRRRRGGMNGRE